MDSLRHFKHVSRYHMMAVPVGKTPL